MTTAVSDDGPRNDAEVKLVELFTSRLNTTSLGIHDDYFSHGYNDKISALLVQDINQAFEINLRVEDLAKHKTIAKLSKLTLKGKSKLNRHVIPLNRNKNKPPLFFICGIALYSPLAKNLIDDFACYGIYVPEEEGFLKSTGQGDSITIPRLAELYIKVIREHTPSGPYTIAGVSFGGVLAFEIARQLRLADQDVAGLVILDAVLPGSLKRGWKLIIKGLLSKCKVLSLKRFLPKSNASASGRELRKKQLWQIIKGKSTQKYFNSNPTFSEPTLIIRAADQAGCKLAPDLCWGPRLSGAIILGEAPGSHLEILQSKTTAEYIINYIRPSAVIKQL